MDIFKLPTEGKDSNSINRTIRWRGDLYDRIMAIIENSNKGKGKGKGKNKVSFNRLVNDAVEFALNHMEENEDKK